MFTKLKPEILQKADEIIAKYPEKRSAIMPLLHLAQDDHGYICHEIIEWVAAKTEVAPIDVLGVVTFYPMFHQKPMGKYQVRVCRTLSCALRGAYHTMEVLEKELNIKRGETSRDGAISIEFVECLASCDTGPVAQINRDLYHNIIPENAKEFASKIRIMANGTDEKKTEDSQNNSKSN